MEAIGEALQVRFPTQVILSCSWWSENQLLPLRSQQALVRQCRTLLTPPTVIRWEAGSSEPPEKHRAKEQGHWAAPSHHTGNPKNHRPLRLLRARGKGVATKSVQSPASTMLVSSLLHPRLPHPVQQGSWLLGLMSRLKNSLTPQC